MAVAALTITENREKVVDFSVPFMYYTDEMLIKKASSDNGSIDYLQFMNPLHNNVWFATLASLVVVSVAVFVINYFSPFGYKDENGRGTSEEFTFFNSVWFTLACMLQQGGENHPRSLSGTAAALIGMRPKGSSVALRLPRGHPSVFGLLLLLLLLLMMMMMMLFLFLLLLLLLLLK